MSPEKVWSRFERKGKDGKVLKLRIQDLPPARVDDALDLMMNNFVRESAIYKAVGIRSNSVAAGKISKFYNQVLRNPSSRTVICCADDTDDVKDIMGLAIVHLTNKSWTWRDHFCSEAFKSQEIKEISEIQSIMIYNEMKLAYDPRKEFKLDNYYDGGGAFIAPAYRGLGIAKEALKVRRMMCEAHKVPMAGAWMTAINIQKAAAMDGWETVCEIPYDYLAKKYNVHFADVPPTMKYMVTRSRL